MNILHFLFCSRGNPTGSGWFHTWHGVCCRPRNSIQEEEINVRIHTAPLRCNTFGLDHVSGLCICCTRFRLWCTCCIFLKHFHFTFSRHWGNVSSWNHPSSHWGRRICVSKLTIIGSDNAWRLAGAKTSSAPMLKYCWFEPQQQTSAKF